MTRPTFAVLWRESHATSAVLAGLVAGVPASLVAAFVLAGADVLAGRPATGTLLHLAGYVVSPDSAPKTLWAAALLVHLAVSLFWGAVWGVLVAFTAHHLPPVAGALWGAAFGFLVWFLTFFLVLPWGDPGLAAMTPVRVGVLWHVAYGATLGGLFHVARIRERERHRIGGASG